MKNQTENLTHKMGYCPYYCIFCNYEEDNGWDNKTYSLAKAAQLTGKSVSYFQRILDHDDRRTLSECDLCLKRPSKYSSEEEDEEKESDEKLIQRFNDIVLQMKARGLNPQI